ncbi:PstS family phosphate ABC transporter substrate-binding protein [Bacillus marinisedimentorum]|uniref:PstS family phosphate ABC transporter substrate-binding protein n=1 Tax=Bacillus marinisedimentorum TaxID=1821260 RepID=UPI0007E25391|nr:PstS family phosphate ABC transporter substrate-binding protein [Bacillus marinisedimentorum]
MKSLKQILFFTIMAAVLVFASACGNDGGTGNSGGGSGEELSGNVKIAGSSTVYPIMLGLAEEYQAEQPEVNVTVDSIGSGGGFERATKGQIDFSNASRPIKDEEKKIAEENDVNLEEVILAYDGLTVAVSQQNDYVDSLTVDQLKEIFLADSGKTKWSDINPDWPDETIKIFAPGHDSGTFDYFNEVILEDKPMREDEGVTLSEDDNVLVRGIQNDPNAIGFFGYAYYYENQQTLKALGIDNGNGPVKPDMDTIQSGEYEPLSRPLFTYLNTSSLEKPEVKDFAKFVLENAGMMAEEVGYVPLPEDKYAEQKEKIKSLTAGE